ncbi:MAG TPA: TlpA disulfide reductase family protein [Acidimicrobiales bacterium]|nr:TlpA disulfide reductase family protein [Acidimicrobiales bacterium]
MSTPTTDALAPVRRRHVARWIAGSVLAVLVVVSVVLATRPTSQASPTASPLLGHRAPALSGTTLDGRHLSLAAYRGRFVFVDFFASWCAPCQAEEQSLVAFDYQQQRAAHGAALIGVVFNDPDAAARQFVDLWGARWPALTDPGGVAANDYGVASPPTTFLVDRRGVVVGDLVGPATAGQLDGLLARAERTGA